MKKDKYHGGTEQKAGHAFQNLKTNIDFDGVKKTITWDEGIDIEKVLTDVILKGKDDKRLKLEIRVVGGVKLKVLSQCLIDFERKYHYLSQPSRIRESSRSCLGIHGIVDELVNTGIDTIVDFSGRMGISSAIMKAFLNPKVHYINEAEASWMPHLRLNFPEASIVNKPFKECFSEAPLVDLALIDYCSFIPARDFDSIIPALEIGHRRIILTDASPFFWHLNREAYTRGLFKAPKKHDKYIEMFSNYLSKNYGYNIVRSIRRNTICTHLLEKGKRDYSGELEQFSELFSVKDTGFTIHVSLGAA